MRDATGVATFHLVSTILVHWETGRPSSRKGVGDGSVVRGTDALKRMRVECGSSR